MGLIDRLKSEADGKGIQIQSSDSLLLEKVLNNMFYLDHDIEGETKFIKHIMTRGLETQERVGLHASAVIAKDDDWCVRQHVLSLIYKQLQGEQIPVGLKRIFEEGNAIHEKWQRLFIRAGYSTYDQLDATQLNKKYRVSFTPDIICEIPEFYKGKMVGEIKSVNCMQFDRMKKHPSASKQLQWYMYLTGIHKGFVLNDNKNNQSFKLEVYDYDESLVEPYIDRCEQIKFYYKRVMKEGKMVKRPSKCKSSNSKLCEKCPMRDACWNIGMGKVKIKE